jgi:hypothetical protein
VSLEKTEHTGQSGGWQRTEVLQGTRIIAGIT